MAVTWGDPIERVDNVRFPHRRWRKRWDPPAWMVLPVLIFLAAGAGGELWVTVVAVVIGIPWAILLFKEIASK